MDIRILELIEGSKHAEGLTVVIDVFRAFSLECYLFDRGAREILPVGDIEKAYSLKKANPSRVLIGERGGKKCEGCDFGNSPSQTMGFDFNGHTVIHTTSAGTQGVKNAVHASEIIGGALVNARAVAEYILRQNPSVVSLVAMGENGVVAAKEDVLCAEYIRSMLLGEKFDIEGRIAALRYDGGQKFFLPQNQEVFPEADYFMCVDYDKFPFVIKIGKNDDGMNASQRVEVL